MNVKLNVIIAGYSSFSWALVRELRGRLGGGKLYFVQPERDLAVEAGMLEGVIAVQGDIASTEVLDQLDLAHCHTFIASSREEQANILSALYAQNNGAQHVYARLFNAKLMPLLESVGIMPLQTSYTAAAFTAIRILKPSVAELVSLTRGQFDLEEIRASDYPELIGCRLGNLEGANLNIIAVDQGGKVWLDYNTVVQADATLIIIYDKHIEKQLRQELRYVASQAAQRIRAAGGQCG